MRKEGFVLSFSKFTSFTLVGNSGLYASIISSSPPQVLCLTLLPTLLHGHFGPSNFHSKSTASLSSDNTKFVKSKTSGCGIMNHTNGAHHPVLGVEASGNAMSYTNSTFQTAATVPPTESPAVAISSPSQPQPSFPASQAHHHAYHQVQHLHSQQQQQQQQLQAFWANQMLEIEQTTDFKNHILPLARIKKIMKTDEDVRMISAEAPVIFAKACEIFILELTLRSWIHTEENKRRTLHKNDIAAAISRTDVFDFLVDIIPRDELKEEGLGVTKATIPFVGSSADSIPYYYPVGPTGFMVEKPLDQASIYPGQQPQPSLSFMPWPQSQHQPQPHLSQSQKSSE